MANLEGKFAYPLTHTSLSILLFTRKSHSICRRSPHVPDSRCVSECVRQKVALNDVCRPLESSGLPDDFSPDFLPFFFLSTPDFPRPMFTSRNDGSSLTFPLNRSAAPFAISSPWMNRALQFSRSFLLDFAKAGSGRLPWCVNFSGASCAALSCAAPTQISLRQDINRVTKIDRRDG